MLTRKGNFPPSKGNFVGILKSIPTKFVSLLAKGERELALVALAAGVAIVFLESVVRKLLGFSIIISNEVGELTSVILIFGCVSWIYLEKAHLRASFLIDKLPKRTRQFWDVFLAFISLIIVAYIAYLWWGMTIQSKINGRALRMSHIIEWPFQMVGMAGWVSLMLVIIQDIVNQIRQNLIRRAV